MTGAAGMIGSSVCKQLLENGNKVIGIDNFWRGSFQNIENFQEYQNFEFRLCDLRFDTDWAFDISNYDVILHIADIVAGIGYVFSNEAEVFRNNILINSNVSSVIRKHAPEKIIYLGTACSYPQDKQMSVESSELSEVDKFPADPESGYGWSKLMGEVELKLSVKNIKTKLIVLDLHNVYGWPCIYKDNSAQVIPALIWRACNSIDRELLVWGDGNQGRAFIHVKDVVSAVVKAIEYDGDEDNFMIGPEYCTTIKEIAQLIVSHPLISSRGIAFDTTKPTGDIGRYANSSLANKELSWEPRVGIIEGVNNLITMIYQQKH